ncbi:hypothetical protein [Streptomyces mirabilis]|uniref:hypothetical protein n=1 Tax=Streptomyces mirabilis TaxID=68239 RepID=UPI00332B540C
MSQSLPGVDDFNFLNATSDVVLAAQNLRDEVAVVYPNGTTRTVLTASDGLASPTAVRGTTLYVTDGGLVAPHHPMLQTGKINLSALIDDGVH